MAPTLSSSESPPPLSSGERFPPAGVFAALLRRYRTAAGLTQEELAERAGVSVRCIGDMERGKRHTPRADTVALVAAALELSNGELAAFAAAVRRRTLASPAGSTPALPAEMPIVGRSNETASLDRLLVGEGRAVLILAGEPGIGKSRLLREAAQLAAARGWCVLAGGCQRRDGQQPYAPLPAILKRHIQRQTSTRLRGQLQGCAWLVRLLPELAAAPIESLPSWSLSPDQERRLMREAVARFLANIAGPAGILLVLDDLQWASPERLDLLLSVIHAEIEAPLRVVGAYRNTEVTAGMPLSSALADLARAGIAAIQPLPPLAAEDAAELLGRLLEGAKARTPELLERVLRRASGMPFFLTSWAAGIRQGAGVSERDDGVPVDVAQSIRQRVDALPDEARALLRAATVIGRAVPRTLVAGVVALSEEDVVTALEISCHAGLLLEDGPVAYQFAHDVIREVIEADLSTARRAMLHRRIAEAVERDAGEGAVELLAYHYGRSDVPEKALAYQEQAGDQASVQYGYGAAEKHYREAINHLDGTGRLWDSARVREKLGAILRTMARYDDAILMLEAAAATYRARNDLEDLGRVVALLGRTHSDRGTPAQGVATILPVIDLLEAQGPSRALAALNAALAYLHFFEGRYAEQLVAAERAAGLAVMVNDNGILADARFIQGLGLYAIDRPAEALASVEAVIELGEREGHYDSYCYALQIAADIHDVRGEFAEGTRIMERAVRIAERHADPAMIAISLTVRGVIAFYAGDWAAARRDCESAVALMRSVEAYWGSTYPLLDMGRLRLAEGAWAEATSYLDECERLLNSSTDRGAIGEVASVLAERDLLEGRPEEARARLARLLDEAGPQDKGRTYLGLRMAWALLDLGATEAAAEMVAEVVARTRAERTNLYLVDALRVQARVLLKQDNLGQARTVLEEGIALARAMSYPYAEARLLHAYGQLHIQNREPMPARARLEEALAIFRRLGARKDIDQVEGLVAVLV